MSILERQPPRVVIEDVEPEIDAGRFAAKRVVGERVEVRAVIFLEGHDSLHAVLRHRPEAEKEWSEVSMEPLGNDRWKGAFVVEEQGFHLYTLEAWPHPFASWSRDLSKKHEAGQNIAVDLLVGAELIEAAADRASAAGASEDAEALEREAAGLRAAAEEEPASGVRRALSEDLASLEERWPDRSRAASYERDLRIWVDRPRARFSSWYEMFPRSCTEDPREHGTFESCIERLDYVASMGFDIVYLPPIHPIGETFRKGPNNALEAGPEDPGSPWAIGAAEGGHTAVHPELGTLEDFRRFVAAAEERGLEIALDIAFQCSPDHPWVEEHPSWFRHRPDGTIQYAENPPKKYQDIYPLDFESEDWKGLWEGLRDVFLFWVDQGIEVFRVDNPHTKPFRFWEWCIREVRAEHPDVLFLSEAFTRPSVMLHLAKLGFTQSYTYFTWRNTRPEIEEYFRELTGTEVVEFFRPNLWPNTPDILNEYLQTGGRPAFLTRAILASTLGASWGIYGPAFELCEDQPREPGSEEYLHSEKYEIRRWELDASRSLKDLIARLNAARRQHPCLQQDRTLRFHGVDNEKIVCYSKTSGDEAVLVLVNLDPDHRQSGWTDLDLETLGLEPDEAYQVQDLLGGSRYLWEGRRNYVELDPNLLPGHVFLLRRRHRSERDFDYFA